jgi:3'-phosphoadenosine 5'-phosphosulfate sulfotransferase (PAPS reductase)/FAD synthetase
MKTMLSFGAGVQTTALLVLIAQERLERPDAIVFADTGTEKQGTYDYLRDIAEPFATKHSLNITTLGADWRTRTYQGDLERYCLDHHMLPGTWRRWCTSHYKIVPLSKFRRRELGASRDNPTETWIGISTDEKRRAVPSREPDEVKRYPLIADFGYDRFMCEQVILGAGLPVPPKSGCWFCPFMNRTAWQVMKRKEPILFERALAMERNAKGYLPTFGSLEAVASQDEFPGFDDAIRAEAGCVTGACFV